MINKWPSAGHGSLRLETYACRPLPLCIYQVKVIALETWGLLTLRNEGCLRCGAAENTPVFLGRVSGRSVCMGSEVAKGPDLALAWRGQLVASWSSLGVGWGR